MSEVEAVSALMAHVLLREPKLIEAPEGRTLIALPGPDGSYSYEEITSPGKADILPPKLVRQHVNLQTTSSLINYVNRFKNFDTMLFANIAGNSIHAVIDYHKMPEANVLDDDGGAKGTGHNPTSTHAAHNAHLALPFSQEWQLWNGHSDKLMSHTDFATFLEENAVDIKTPDGGGLLELCRDLQVKSNMNFNSSIRMGTTVKLEFQKNDDVSTKDELELPASITIAIPVYFGEPPVTMIAFLRRKIDDGRLFLGYKLSRAENTRQAEFHRIVSAVQTNVELETVYGTAS